MIVFTIVLGVLMTLMAVTGASLLRSHFALTPAQRARVKELETNKADVEGDIKSHKSLLATTTPDDTWSLDYHKKKIAGLGQNLDAIENELLAIEQAPKPRRAPAPQLDPKWDASVCTHSVIMPVIPSGEEAIVAWLCCNANCYDQLELTDPAVTRHLSAEAEALQQDRIAQQWEDTKEWTEGDSSQAYYIAANSFTAEKIFVPIVPNFSGFRKDAQNHLRDRQLRMEKKRQSQIKVKKAPKGSWM